MTAPWTAVRVERTVERAVSASMTGRSRVVWSLVGLSDDGAVLGSFGFTTRRAAIERARELGLRVIEANR